MFQHSFEFSGEGFTASDFIPVYQFTRSSSLIPSGSIRSALQCAQYCRASYGPDLVTFETLKVIYVNSQNQVIHFSLIGSGGISFTVADKKRIFCEALLCGAAAFIVVHNHPSGNLKFSDSDIQLSKDLIKGAKLLGLECMDSLVITAHGYISFKEEGY
jgi:DNA repair protein RadC